MTSFYCDQDMLAYNRKKQRQNFRSFLFGYYKRRIFGTVFHTFSYFLYGDFKNKATIKLKSLLILRSLVFDTIAVIVIKYSVNRQRSFVKNKSTGKLSSARIHFFYSRYTVDAFVIAACITLLFTKNVWALSFVWLWALIVGYSRLVLSLYDTRDVPDNFGLGISNAIFINWFCLKKPNCQSTHV